MSDAHQNREHIATAAARWVARRDAGLSAEERAEFDRWCAADPRHASAAEHYATTWSVLDQPRQAGAILRELRGRVRRRRAMAGAATVLLLVSLMAWRWPQPAVTATVVEAVQPGGTLHAPEKRTLPDGSIVELNRGAELAVEFTPASRRVVLVRGEAHFSVAKNKDRPFVVAVGKMQVRAVGTAFSVQHGAQQIDVLVTEGVIALEKPTALPEAPASAPAQPHAAHAETETLATLATVRAGERVVVSDDSLAITTPVIVVSAVEAAERLTWRAPRVEFSDTPLAEAVAMMNRSSGGTDRLLLVIDPAARSLAREPVSGVFRVDNTEAFVRVLELSLGVHTERRGNQLVMRKGD